MKAALLYGREDLRIEQMQLPELEEGSMLLRMKASGICGSDSRMFFNGPTSRYINPIILGHELSAQVAMVGQGVHGYLEGEFVTIAPVIPCMRCYLCTHGKDNICEKAGVIGCNVHGGMAEYLYVPSQMVHAGGIVKLPSGVDYHAGALAELVGCCLHAWRQTGIEAGDRVMVLGGGPIGMTFLQLAKLFGASWVGMTGRRAPRLELAKELGANETLDPESGNLPEFEGGIDRVIVATHSVRALEDAFKLVRMGGSLMMFSGYLPGTILPLDLNWVHYHEIHIHGSIDCTIRDFQNAVALLPQLRMDKLITCIFTLDEVRDAFLATREPGCVKVMLEL